MSGRHTPAETLERLRKEAKRRLAQIKSGDDKAMEWYRRAVSNPVASPTLRDVQLAIARTLDFPGWTALKRAIDTPLPDPHSPDGLANRFLDNACPDHHVRGKQDHRRAEATAMRLLDQHPDIAHYNLATAVVCGDIDAVRAAITRDPSLANAPIGTPGATRAMAGGENDLYRQLGPKGWQPLLYLAFTRLPLAAANNNAVAIARLLLENGADANAFYHAGDSHYTPMTGVVGEGEEDRPPHPHRDVLTQLFLDFGANPYDNQVVYNLGFHSDYMWWLPMIHAHGKTTGRAKDWEDPAWPMFDMGGYGNGARWMLEHAIRQNKIELADWCLAHGASAMAPPARSTHFSPRSLIDAAYDLGRVEIAALLERYGAKRSSAPPTPLASVSQAALRLDRARVDALIREYPELLANPKPLFMAAEQNRAEALALLLDAGYPVNLADEQNTRPLNYAAWSNALDCVKLLIERGAEVDAVEQNYGGTAFGNASHFLHRDVMEYLVPRTRDVWNLTYNGYAERLQAVLEENPARARVDWDTWSPLLWLPPFDESLALRIAKLLVAHGADPQRRDSSGAAPADRAEAIGMTTAAAWLRQATAGSSA